MSTRKNSKIKVSSMSSKAIPIRENGDNYFYVTHFEQTTEKECKEFDKTNRLIYEKYLSTYSKIKKQLENCPFQLDKEPPAPEYPPNLERLIRWRQNNIEKNVRLQSISLIYLLSKNLKISIDYKTDGILPFEIIDRAKIESNNDMELMIKESNEYLEKMNNEEEPIPFGFINNDNSTSTDTVPDTSSNLYPVINNNNKFPSAPPYTN